MNFLQLLNYIRQDYPCSPSDKTTGIACDPVYLYRNGRPLTTDINQFQVITLN